MKRHVPLLVAIAIVSVGVQVWWDHSGVSGQYPDTELYLRLATNLANHRGFIAPEPIAVSVPNQVQRQTEVPTAIRTPGYPLFLLPFLGLRNPVAAVIAVQKALYLLVVFAMYFFALQATRRRLAGFAASLVLGTYLPGIAVSEMVMSDLVFTVIFTAMIYALWRAAKSSNLLLCSIAGCTLGLSILVRPIALFFPVFGGLFLFLFAQKRRRALTATFVIAALTLPLAWTVRNWLLTGAPVVDTIASENALFFRAAEIEVVREYGYAPLTANRDSDGFFRAMVRIRPVLLDRTFQRLRERGIDPLRISYAQRSVEFTRLAADIVKRHPVDAALLAINGWTRMFTDALWETAARAMNYHDAIFWLLPLALAYVALAGVGWWQLRRRESAIAWLAAATIAYFSILAADPAVESRMTVPFVPMYALLIGSGVAHFFDKLRARQFAAWDEWWRRRFRRA